MKRIKLFVAIFSGIFIVNNMNASQEEFNMFDYFPKETIVHILHHTVKYLGYPFVNNEYYKKDLHLCAVSWCFYNTLVELIKKRHDFDKKKMGYSLVRYLYCQQDMFSAYRRPEDQIKRRPGTIALTLLSIDAGADLNVKYRYGKVSLQLACQYSPEIVPDLINAGADVTANSNAALMIASRYQCELIPLLLEAGADVDQANSAGWTPLMTACKYQYRAVPDLIDAGADVNKTSEGKLTPLMLACLHQFLIVPDLINAGADVNAVNNKNESALLLACQHCIMVVSTLIEAGADVNLSSSCGMTPLMMGCKYWSVLVELLLAAGADVNKINSDGETALFFVCRARKNCFYLLPAWQVVLLLLEAGIDKYIRNSFGHTAFFYALRPPNITPCPNIIPLLVENIDFSKFDRLELEDLLRYCESCEYGNDGGENDGHA